jgi:hypothetical protein
MSSWSGNIYTTAFTSILGIIGAALLFFSIQSYILFGKQKCVDNDIQANLRMILIISVVILTIFVSYFICHLKCDTIEDDTGNTPETFIDKISFFSFIFLILVLGITLNSYSNNILKKVKVSVNCQNETVENNMTWILWMARIMIILSSCYIIYILYQLSLSKAKKAEEKSYQNKKKLYEKLKGQDDKRISKDNRRKEDQRLDDENKKYEQNQREYEERNQKRRENERFKKNKREYEEQEAKRKIDYEKEDGLGPRYKCDPFDGYKCKWWANKKLCENANPKNFPCYKRQSDCEPICNKRKERKENEQKILDNRNNPNNNQNINQRRVSL